MSAPRLFSRLKAAPDRFEIATALRLAEAEAQETGRRLDVTASPGGPPTGHGVRHVEENDAAIILDAPVVALLGPLSPLPPAYDEMAARDRRRRAGGFAAFLDIFTDRLTRAFVEASEKYDLVPLLRWQPGGRNRILTLLYALTGLATPALRGARPLAGDEVLAAAGLLANRTRSAEGLRMLAAAELGLPVRVEQFRLKWRDVPVAERTRMDGTARLGETTGSGSKVADRSGQIRIVVGPVRYPDFLSFEEGRPRIDRLRRLVRLYVGPVLDFDVQIVLDRRDVPETRLGGDGPAIRLGWNAWARAAPAAENSCGAVLGSTPAAPAEVAA